MTAAVSWLFRERPCIRVGDAGVCCLLVAPATTGRAITTVVLADDAFVGAQAWISVPSTVLAAEQVRHVSKLHHLGEEALHDSMLEQAVALLGEGGVAPTSSMASPMN